MNKMKLKWKYWQQNESYTSLSVTGDGEKDFVSLVRNGLIF